MESRSLEWFFDIDGDLFERQYKRHLSGYWDWKDTAEGLHAEQWRVFPQNIGSQLSIDETSLSNGELYTIVTNKAAHGREQAKLAKETYTPQRLSNGNTLKDKSFSSKTSWRQRHQILHLPTLQPACLNTDFLLCAVFTMRLTMPSIQIKTAFHGSNRKILFIDVTWEGLEPSTQ